jgi:hypothetical protein
MKQEMMAQQAAKGAPGGMPAGQQPTGPGGNGNAAAAGTPDGAPQFRQITDVPAGEGAGQVSAMTMRPGPS